MNAPGTSAMALLTSLGVASAGCAPPADQDGETQETGATQETEEQLVERARGIHERVLTLDTHDDINTDNFTDERNYASDLPTQLTLPKMEAGGLDVAWLVVYTGQGPLTEDGYAAAYANAIDKFDAIHRLVNEYAPDRAELALTSEDARRIVASGKKAIMIGVENAYPVGNDMSRIEEFHRRGARYMSLAHTGPSQFSDAHSGEQDGNWLHDGLSEMGLQAVAEMNRLGIMVDISHPSKASIMQTLEIAQAPVIASHSSARGINDVSRNLDDEQLRAVAENGGVVQTVALRRFLNAEKAEARRQAEEEGGEVEVPDVDVADFVDHIDYMVNLIGLDHVGISSDFDGGGGVAGWDDASQTFNVTLELARRGYSEEEIAKLWSGNLLRVLDEVQAVAARIQAEGRK